MRKKMFIWSGIIILLIVYLYFASDLVLLLTDKKDDIIKLQDEQLSIENHVYDSFDTMYSLDNFTHDYFIEGWAFVECPSLGEYNDKKVLYENLDKRIFLYLVSNKEIYKIETNPISRLDLCYVFAGNAYIHGVYHGYSATFSTIDIKDGTYELWIKVIENEVDQGTTCTTARFQKEGKNFYRYEGNDDKDVKEKRLTVENEMEFYLDGVYVENGKIGYEGWGLLLNVDMTDMSYYIKAEDDCQNCHYYKSTVQMRPDIAEAFGEAYSETGIKGYIDVDEFEAGDITLSLVIGTQDGMFESEKRIVLHYQDGEVTIVNIPDC